MKNIQDLKCSLNTGPSSKSHFALYAYRYLMVPLTDNDLPTVIFPQLSTVPPRSCCFVFSASVWQVFRITHFFFLVFCAVREANSQALAAETR